MCRHDLRLTPLPPSPLSFATNSVTLYHFSCSTGSCFAAMNVWSIDRHTGVTKCVRKVVYKKRNAGDKIDMIYYDILVNCNWFDIRWQ